jgi:hypothetical protein
MRRMVALFLVVVGVAATGGTARAGGGLLGGLLGGNCGVVAPVFLPWGDWSLYYYAANGGFESGSTGWTLAGGASVEQQQNEPWYLAGFGSHALTIPAGGSASISTCYGLTYPAVRFFVAGQDGPSTVRVRVVTRGLLGVLSVLDGGTFSTAEGWSPSPKTSTLFSALAAPLGAKSMTLQFTVERGTAQIDDVFVDPFLSRG